MKNRDYLKEKQFQKYSSFDIPKDILDSMYDSITYVNNDVELLTLFNKKIDKYVLKQIQNDNIDIIISVIEYYNFIKTIVVKNPKYDVPKKDLDRIYEMAIEMLKDRYNYNNTMSMNILDNMTFIITNGINYIKPKEEEKEYSISFMKYYIKYYNISKESLSNILDVKISIIDDLLNGTKQIKEDNIKILYSLYNVNNYEELKDFILNKVCNYREKLLKQHEEQYKEKMLNEEEKQKVLTKQQNILKTK